MELTLLLGRIVAILFLVLGFSGILNRRSFGAMVKELRHHSLVLYLWSVLELTAGLFLILQHDVWHGWGVIVTILGWLMVIEGALVNLFPKASIKLAVLWKSENTILAGSLFAVIVGLYLAIVAF